MRYTVVGDPTWACHLILHIRIGYALFLMGLRRVIRLLLSAIVLLCGCGNPVNRLSRGKEAAITLVPPSGEGPNTMITVTLTPEDIFENIGVLYNAVLDGGHACYVYYNPMNTRFSIVKDSGSGADSMIEGAPFVENTQCALANTGGTRAEVQNKTLILHLAISFKSQFEGPKNIYVYSEYKDGRKPTIQQEGTWFVAP